MDFISVLTDLKNGRVVSQLGDDFGELVAAVHQHGFKGKMVIELTVEPARTNDGVVKEVDVHYQTKVTKPRPNHGKTLFYVDKDATLSRNDPSQMDLDWKKEKAN